MLSRAVLASSKGLAARSLLLPSAAAPAVAATVPKRNLNLLEYQAKGLLQDYNVTVQVNTSSDSCHWKSVIMR